MSHEVEHEVETENTRERENERVRRDWRLPDELWQAIQPLLPERKMHPLGCHRPRVPDRAAMDAIFFVLRTGCQWNALSATGLCSSSSAHRRFQEWVQAGVFLEIWKRGLLAYDALIGIDWSWLAMDGAMSKAPLGGEKHGAKPYRPRKTRHQAQCVDGGKWHPWHPDRAGGFGSEPQRLQDGAGHDPEHPDRAARANRGRARDVSGQGL